MNNTIRIFIEEKVQYFSISQIVIYFSLIAAAELLRSVIVKYKLPMFDIPHVQMSSLMESIEE